MLLTWKGACRTERAILYAPASHIYHHTWSPVPVDSTHNMLEAHVAVMRIAVHTA